MKRSLLVVALLSATFVTACSKKHNSDGSSAVAAVDTKSALEKTAWTTGCQTEAYEASTSYSKKLEFKDGFLTTTKSFFGTSDCSGKPVNTSTEVNAYEVDNSKAQVQLMNITGGQPGGIGAEKVKGDMLNVKLAGQKLTLTRIDAAGNLSSDDYTPFVEAAPAPVAAKDTSLIPHDTAPGPVAPYMYQNAPVGDHASMYGPEGLKQ